MTAIICITLAYFLLFLGIYLNSRLTELAKSGEHDAGHEGQDKIPVLQRYADALPPGADPHSHLKEPIFQMELGAVVWFTLCVFVMTGSLCAVFTLIAILNQNSLRRCCQ